jgi:MFS family permease
MPDVTIKPLRSKANAVINLMGAAGGIIVLILGTAFGTGRGHNALMNYTLFFACVAGLMLVSLVIFLRKVKEPMFVEEMHKESRKFGLEESDDDVSGGRRLSKAERRSLLLILASVIFWFFGYNAVTSKYSVYASSVLNLDYNATLTIATGAALLSYIPVGAIASKVGRKKTIMAGIIILGVSFLCASFIRAGSSTLIMNILFATAGIGWATINVNSYPMVVELSKGGDVGKYTGFYYTASMAAQTLTPAVSGIFMDKIGMTTLFPYGCVFVLLSFGTMLFVRHGDNRPIPGGSMLEALGGSD